MPGLERMPPFEETIGASLIAATESVIGPLRDMLRDFDVTEQQWRVLRVVNDRGRCDATTIARVGLFHASSVTRLVQDLLERELLVRIPVDDDRRRSLISLSPKGKELIRRTSGKMANLLHGLDDVFGQERLSKLSGELQALKALLDGT